MPPIRTHRSGFGLAFAAATLFIFLCTVPGILMLKDYEPNLDGLFLSCLAGGLVFTVALFIGHLVLRRLRVSGRWAYAFLGAVALGGAYASQMPPSNLAVIASKGLLFYFFTFPVLTGAVFGYIYAWRAGWEHEREHPDVLSQTLEAGAGAAAAPEPALVQTPEARYFSGPLRVRTSFVLMFLSAVLSTLMAMGARAALNIGYDTSQLENLNIGQMAERAAAMSLGAGLEMFFLVFIGTVPIFLCVMGGHFIARGLKATSAWAYFGIGLLMPFAFALISLGFAIAFTLMMLLPAAIGMVLYRQFAGLEPTPVREDILAEDERDLVGAEHARRRFGRVLKTR